MAKKSKIDKKQIGIGLIVIGGGLIIWGIQRYGAFGEKVSRALEGSSSNETMMILIAGGVAVALGAYQFFRK